jgi:RNA polymerase primary sigma factor
VERNKRNRKKGMGLREQVPKRSYRSEQSEDALILSDELDVDVASEFPGLKVGDGNVLARGEEEVIEHELETFGRATDPVRIYLMEMGSFPLLTREGEVEIAKRIENGQGSHQSRRRTLRRKDRDQRGDQ